MSLVLVAVVLAIGAGAVVAVSTRESRAAPIGLAVALVAAALLAEPLPSAPILGVRITAALLAATLVRWAAQGGARQLSPLGWPAEALFATAGAVAGLGIALGLASIGSMLPGGPVGPGGPGGPFGPIGPGGPGGPGVGPGLPSGESTVLTMALTVAAASALLAVGFAPAVHGPPGIRRAVGLVLVAQAVLLLRTGIGGPSADLEEIARAGLLVACAATGAALARAATQAQALEDAEPYPAPRGRAGLVR